MPLTFLPFRFPFLPRVACAFQCRAGGLEAAMPATALNSPALFDKNTEHDNISLEVSGAGAITQRNRAALARSLGVHAFAELRQVHGVRMVFDPAPQNPGTAPHDEADGLSTSQVGLALMIKTADCQPILLAEKKSRFVAALHVGWKGNALAFIPQAIAALCQHYECRPADMCAVRGPSLGPGAAEFVNFEQEWPQGFAPWFDQQRKVMNLWQLSYDQLCLAGIPEQSIFSLDMCTYSLPALFYSYRRSQRTGRQGSFIWLCE